MPKEGAAHIPLDPHAEDVPPIAHDIGENALDHVNGRHDDRPHDEEAKVLVGDVVVHDIPRNHGIEHIADGNEKGTDQIHDKKFFMRPIVRKKPADKLHIPSAPRASPAAAHDCLVILSIYLF